MGLFLFPFEISQSEISRAQWASLTGVALPSDQSAHMPEIVSDISNLITSVASIPVSGAGALEIPTQAEWELSALGDRLQHHALYPWPESFPFGEGVSSLADDGLRCDRALTVECGVGLNMVKANPLGRSNQGLYGLGGNVAEWVSDATGYRLVGGSVDSLSNMLLLSSWVESDDPQLDAISPPTGRGVRLVIRTR